MHVGAFGSGCVSVCVCDFVSVFGVLSLVFLHSSVPRSVLLLYICLSLYLLSILICRTCLIFVGVPHHLFIFST